MRRNLLYISSDVSRIASAKPSYESRELHQVTNARDRAPLTHDDFGIRRNEICPLPGYRADGLFVDPQQEPHAGSVAPLAHAQELSPPQWMERVRYAHKTRRSDRRVCNLSRVTSALSVGASRGLRNWRAAGCRWPNSQRFWRGSISRARDASPR
jgi:hypothetical protein